MGRLMALTLLAAAAFAATGGVALAQADAQQAFAEAKAAYERGDYQQARQAAKRASQTDNQNAEVFLLLGKAHYQLGALDEAIAAWQRTLALAPEEPHARQMLDALRGKLTEYDARLKLVRLLVDRRLFAPAQQQCASLLADAALSDAQRAAAWLLQAEIAVGQNQPAEALRILGHLRIHTPEAADSVTADLWEGVARLRTGGLATAEGLQLLARVQEAPAEHPAVAVAAYELAVFHLGEEVTAERAEALAAWRAAHAEHPLAEAAVPTLLSAYMTLARRAGAPQPDAQPDPWDVRARALIETAAAAPGQAEGLVQLHANWLKHIEEHYATAGAYDAAVQLVQLNRGVADWPRDVRLAALRALLGYRSELAIRQLEQQARRGELPAEVAPGQLPPPLAEVLAVCTAIHAESPDQPAWNPLADFAARVRAFSARVAWPAAGTTLKGPDAWSIELTVPILRSSTDAAVVQKAVDQFHAIIRDYSQPGDAAAHALRVEMSRRLLGTPLSPDHPAWTGALLQHAELLGGYAQFLFEENLRAGRAEANAQPSPPLEEMLDMLGKLVAHHVDQAAGVRQLVERRMVLWHEHGQAAVVDAAYEKLIAMLPESERRHAELTLAGLWIDRAGREHQRLLQAGLSVPRQLDPRHVAALKRLYLLQAGLGERSEELARVRAAWQSVPAHYRALDYPDLAAEAIQVKADEAVAAADAFAAFELVRHGEQEARTQLTRLLREYGAKDKIELTPAFREVIAAWQAFIRDHAAGTLAGPAAEQVFGIGRLYEQHQAFRVAADVYAGFAEFAAEIPVLSQARPGTAGTTERALFARAAALDAHARKLLAQAASRRQEGDPPPEALSDEFTAAIEAYRQFIEAYPAGPLVGDALDKIMAVAFEYARQDAWGVAEGVLADLLDSELAIRRPERLLFAQGLCQLGRAMPEHAREALGLLTGGGWRSGAPPDISAIAALDALRGVGEGDRRMADDDLAERPAEGLPADPFAPPSPAIAQARPMLPGGDLADGAPAGPVSNAEPADISNGLDHRGAQDASRRDSELLAMIRRQESSRAQQVAQLRQQVAFHDAQVSQAEQQNRQSAAGPVYSEAELERQQAALAAAYAIFQRVRTDYPTTPTAEQARGEILLMVGHWRGMQQWERAAALASRYVADNATDRELPRLRLEIARDRLAWAARPIDKALQRQALIAEVASRFASARSELAKVIADFPAERPYRQEAQWDIAASHLTEARSVAAVSPTLARGQFVRAAKELQRVAREYADHPRIGEVAGMLWSIAAELESRGFDEEAIVVWSDLLIHDPLGPQAQPSAMQIAGTYHRKLNRPLKAAEIYQEQFFARGGSDSQLQDAIFQIGSELKEQKRWVEALHVLETFVDGFPHHPQAGQALTIIGQVHQTNEAWEDAIAAYKRVAAEFDDGPFVQEAKWAIAECTINLSRWREASAAYRDFAAAYPEDGRVAEANRRIEILKDLERYQVLVDEKDQRRAFDAQYQIAEILRTRLANPVKAVIEYRKVVEQWPQSHLADNALYEAGAALLALGETQKGRDALREVAARYPTSPLADDALLLVGQSFEQEAQRLATVTRETTLARNWELTQRSAYDQARSNVRRQQEVLADRVASLKMAGKGEEAELEQASAAAGLGQFNLANTMLFARRAEQDVEALTAAELADRQDRINAALRKAVEAYQAASQVPGADKADDALLAMATIYDEQLKDSEAAMRTWLEIVRQFSGTSVAEDASWRIAQYYQREGNHAEAVKAFEQFFRNYRRSPKAGDAQFAVAENYERLGQWVAAMDAYTNYINNFPDGTLADRAREQITWIRTYRL